MKRRGATSRLLLNNALPKNTKDNGSTFRCAAPSRSLFPTLAKYDTEQLRKGLLK
jgi:hypothetical protein